MQKEIGLNFAPPVLIMHLTRRRSPAKMDFSCGGLRSSHAYNCQRLRTNIPGAPIVGADGSISIKPASLNALTKRTLSFSACLEMLYHQSTM